MGWSEEKGFAVHVKKEKGVTWEMGAEQNKVEGEENEQQKSGEGRRTCYPYLDLGSGAPDAVEEVTQKGLQRQVT